MLFLTPQLPYPPISGGVIKSFKLLQFLSAEHQLALACFLKSAQDEANLAALKAAVKLDKVLVEPLNIARTPLNFLKSCLANIPLTIYRNRSGAFAKKINAIANDYEVIFVDHYLMFQYIPTDFNGRVVVHQHNAEFVIWSRLAEQTTQMIKRWAVNFEAKRIRRFEVEMCRRADSVLAAPNDQQALIAAGSPDHHFIDTYHLGDEENLSLAAIEFDQTDTAILFIGTLTWEANIDGLLWFLTAIWPRIKQHKANVTFSVVGKCSDALKAKLLRLAPDIQLLGFVDDLDVLYQSHRVFVAPLRFGSGIKVKVVNGLYRGIPTVTTSVGAEGLKLNSGEHLFIKDEAVNFADKVTVLLKNPHNWQQLSVQSREHMRRHYTWDVVFDNVQRSLTGE